MLTRALRPLSWTRVWSVASVGLTAFLASCLFGARPTTSFAQADLSSPDYHFTYWGEATYTGGEGNSDTLKWTAEGDAWVIPNAGTDPMPAASLPLTSLAGTRKVTFPGYPTCTATLEKSDGKPRLTFRYYALNLAGPEVGAPMNGDPYMEFSFPYVPMYMKVTDHKPADDRSCENTSGIYDLFNPITGANGFGDPPDQHDAWLAAYVARTDLNPPEGMQNSTFEQPIGYDNVQPPREVHIHSTVRVQLLEANSR